jgi:hypothetical protein
VAGAPGATGAQGPQGPSGAAGAPGASYIATSTTVNPIAFGAHTYATQAGLAYTVGARARATSNGAPNNWVEGIVTAYSGAAITITADLVSGSGSFSDWNINLAGQIGATGATGAQGSTGPQGGQGVQGVAGPTGPGYTATSATSATIGLGSVTMTTQAGLAYTAGARVRLAATSAPAADWMEGVCTAYSGTALTVNVDLINGSGTFTSWTINTAGQTGAAGTPTFSTQAQAEAGIDTTTSLNPLGATQHLNASVIGPFKNLVGRNGGFEVSQQGNVTYPNGVTGYVLDGWYAVIQQGQTQFAQYAGLTPTSGYSLKVQRLAGETATGQTFLGFPIDTDELIQMRGKTVLWQFKIATGANFSPTSLGARLLIGTGIPVKQQIAGYTNQTKPIDATITTTTNMGVTTYYFTADIPATISGANVGQAEVQFYWQPTAGAAGAQDAIFFDDVDLRVVPTSLPANASKPAFERTPFVADLARCKRHYEQSYSYGTAPGTNTQINSEFSRLITAGAFLWTIRTVEKRAVPAVTSYSTTGAPGFAYNNAAGVNIPVTVDNIGTSAFRVTQASGGAAGTASDGMCFHWISDARP